MKKTQKFMMLITRTQIRNVVARLHQYVETEGFDNWSAARIDLHVEQERVRGNWFNVWAVVEAYDGGKISKKQVKQLETELNHIAKGIEFAIKHDSFLVPASFTYIDAGDVDNFIRVNQLELV